MIVTLGEHRYALVDSGLRVALPDDTDTAVDCSPRPVLLISASDTILEPGEILNQIQRFPKADDVFDDGFISDVLLIADDSAGNEQRLLLLAELARNPVLNGKHWHLNSVYGLEPSTSRATIPSGPYFLGGNAVFQAWKLYTDEFSCFQTTVLPTEIPYIFKNLNAISPNGAGMSVAVPSRLYARPSAVKPLAGVRVAVKDNFRLAGTKSAVGNRPFLATYDVDEETAAFVKTLIDFGAVIVGKTKMTAFASGEKPCDWFDFQCPFNPRGDSYLEPGASSTGSAAATAAYHCMDICIGTDTNGSVTEPAARCGVYGIRCSTDAWGPTTGLYPCSPVFDTFPSSILYPTEFFPRGNQPHQEQTNNFIHLLEEFLGVKKTTFSLTDRWARNPPQEAEGKSLADYAIKTGYNPFYYDMYHEYDTLRADHLKKFGTKAYVSPRIAVPRLQGQKRALSE